VKRIVTIAGHRYSDPDVLSLIDSDGGTLDPRLEVITRAHELNEQLRDWGPIDNPRKRIEILASLAGIDASPMATAPPPALRREALLYKDAGGARHAFYNPTTL
jgi:hypothetical protein